MFRCNLAAAQVRVFPHFLSVLGFAPATGLPALRRWVKGSAPDMRGRMSDATGINVLAVCGSLRAGSYNRAALRTAIELKPPGMTIETADIGSFPLYNEDVRAQGFPAPVETFRRQIAAAAALLFVSPEYNYSI